MENEGAINLTDLAISLVTLGIIVSIGALITHNVATSQVTNLPSYHVYNETLNLSKVTPTYLSKGWIKSIDIVTNATDATGVTNGTLTVANYTSYQNPDTGSAYLQSLDKQFDNKTVNVSYQVYNTSDARFATAENASAGIGEYGNWFKILVIVGIAAVVLAIVYMAFGKREESTGGVVY